MKRQGRNIKYSPIIRFASIVASVILVLNLLPMQGIAEARDELVNAMTQPVQEQTQNNAPPANQAQRQQTQPAPAETSTTTDAPSVEESKPEGGEQNNNSGEAKPAEDDDESDQLRDRHR